MAATTEMLTTSQVARLLGVRTQTVYAYVSRGRLTAHRRPGERRSWFRLDEVEALRGGGRPRTQSRADGEPVHTRITEISDDDSLLFRGTPAVDLAAASSVEQTAALLWEDGRDAVDMSPDPAGVDRVRSALGSLPGTARHIDRLRLAAVLLASHDLDRHDRRPSAVRARAARVLGTVATALLPEGAAHLDDAPLAARWAAVVGADAGDALHVDLVRRVLVLHADHDLATSTTAVRAAASVHADATSCLLAGLGAMDSPLHGTAGVAARLVLEAAAHDPAVALADAVARTTPPPGFGHKVYRERDPRAEHLLTQVRSTLPSPVEQAAATLEDGLMAEHGWFPNSDWATALVTLSLDLPPDAGPGLFAAARMVGWVAHVLEEYGEVPLRFRFSGLYTGPR